VKVPPVIHDFVEARRIPQVTDELEILGEKAGSHRANHRGQEPGVPIQTFPEGPLLILRKRAVEPLAKERPELLLLVHALIVVAAPKLSTQL